MDQRSGNPSKRLRPSNDDSPIGLDTFSNDVIVCIVMYLDGREMVDLALTCRKLGARIPQSELDWSSVEEAARRLLGEKTTEDERDLIRSTYCAKLPRSRGQSWIGILCCELEVLRRPLAFDQLHGYHIQYDGDKDGDGEKSAVKVLHRRGSVFGVCNHVMRAGRHFATLTCTEVGFDTSGLAFGVGRPVDNYPHQFMAVTHWDELLSKRTDKWGDGNVNNCIYTIGDSTCFWTDWETRALTHDGEYCWMISTLDITVNRFRVHIRRESPPPVEP